MDHFTVEVTRALGRNGVDSLVLKGPSFARWLYDSHLDRPYGDTDLLVPPARVAEAEEVLTALGLERFARPLAGDRPWASMDWHTPGNDTIVDLHRALVGVSADPQEAWTFLWARRETMPLPGGGVFVLDLPGRLLLVCLHAAQHGGGQPLIDLRRAATKTAPDLWEQARDLAGMLGATEAFAAGLGRVPEGADMAVRLRLPAGHSVEVELRARGGGTPLFFDWLEKTNGVSGKAALLVRKILPPPDYMRSWFPRARNGRGWLIVGYLYRPLALIRVGIPGFIRWWRAKRAVRRDPY